jgi:hypothetical protein
MVIAPLPFAFARPLLNSGMRTCRNKRKRFKQGGKTQWGAGIAHPQGRGLIALIFQNEKLWGNPLRRARVQPSALLLLRLLLLRKVGCAWAHRLLGSALRAGTGPLRWVAEDAERG